MKNIESLQATKYQHIKDFRKRGFEKILCYYGISEKKYVKM